ncbi:MAG: [FeFe] hydrogenase H-cluster radical SAM maturase HydG [Spirochaetales bacterium]|nr:[FeFe] hydrogenase H-cluster radical SAM maturase HydG [Spirochaetales bacterium]
MLTKNLDIGSKLINFKERDMFLEELRDFIDEDLIARQINMADNPDSAKIREIIAKARSIERLEPEETAALLNVKDPDLWDEIFKSAGEIKKTVYDNRIVTFAPLYISNYCVNNCLYCGFRSQSTASKRHQLSQDDIKKEVKNLLQTGHKRIILVSGEHPCSGAEYLADSMKSIYDTKILRQGRESGIRRINVNAAPMSIGDLRKIKEAGIGTYQVFQETYHRSSYSRVHLSGAKSDFRWRLYALHRAMEAGIDDVAVGALFGLYDWRFEVMGLLYHAIDLEKRYGIGPHTVSFPRLNYAEGAEYKGDPSYKVNDEDFKKVVAVIRLSIPYSGMIVSAREPKAIRDEVLALGCTQTDGSAQIGIGGYTSEAEKSSSAGSKQFELGDNRSLGQLIRDLAAKGTITSFCTAGYRCGRTGGKIMGLLKSGHEGKFCKLNAILTFKEWIEDFGDQAMRDLGNQLIQKEFQEIERDDFYKGKRLVSLVKEYYQRIEKGERDLYI